MVPTPSELQLDLFRALEDVHDLTGAVVVLLTDEEGRSIAVSGDEDTLPPSLRAVLSGRRLAGAGSVRELLAPIAAELVDSLLNVTIRAVDGGFVLAIAFDSTADLDTVQAVSAEASAMLGELLGKRGDDGTSGG